MTEKQVVTADAIEQVDSNPDLHFLTYQDLEARRILGSRTQLMRLQRTAGFPRPMRIGGRAVWSAATIRAYLVERALSGQPMIFAAAAGGPKPHSPAVRAMLAARMKP